jgi:hypothetical protein
MIVIVRTTGVYSATGAYPKAIARRPDLGLDAKWD